MIQLPIKMPDLPPFRESVYRAVSAENLRAAASSTAEPLRLLGLAFLARSGDQARKEICDRAVQLEPQYAQIGAFLSVALDRIDGNPWPIWSGQIRRTHWDIIYKARFFTCPTGRSKPWRHSERPRSSPTCGFTLKPLERLCSLLWTR